MSHLRAKIVSAIVIAGVAVPAAAHSAREHSAKLRAEREMAEFAKAIEPVSIAASGARRVTINGATMYFDKHTEQGTLDDVMARIAKECAAGTQASAFGITNLDDGDAKPIRLEHVHTQGDDEVRASLCIFAKDGPSDGDEARRARYTLAHRREDGSISVTTVVNACATPLNELFPAEGDAPGTDFEGVARPEQARRTFTAVVGKGEHTVRVYESPMPVEGAVASYDRQMTALGFVTTGALDDARMYRKDGKSWVASFRGTTGGSTVAVMPFGPHGGPSSN